MRIATAMGLIPQAANPRTNPDGLPVGLTKTCGYGRSMEGRDGRPELRSLPYRAADLQREEDSHRRWVANTFDSYGVCRCP